MGTLGMVLSVYVFLLVEDFFFFFSNPISKFEIYNWTSIPFEG